VGTSFLDRHNGKRNHNIIITAGGGSSDSECSRLLIVSFWRPPIAIYTFAQTTHCAKERIKRDATSGGCPDGLCKRAKSAEGSRISTIRTRGYSEFAKESQREEEDERAQESREGEDNEYAKAKVKKAAQVSGVRSFG